MFPTLNYLINYIFGTHWTFNFPPTFGTLVAIAFLSAAWVMGRELKRKEGQGLLKGVPKKVKVGEPASATDLVFNGILGFIIGMKLFGGIFDGEAFQADPQGYLLSGQGNFFGGIVVGAIAVAWKYFEKKKKQLPTPKEETIIIRPYQMVGNITIAAAISGIIGAKIFHQLEYWDEFVRDPIGNLTSTSGLTFYGGLIGGFLGVWWYVRRQKMPLVHVADAVAPGLILAYGLGRIGCMLSGDGDWGIINSAYRISDDRKYEVVSPEAIQQDLDAPYMITADNQPIPVYSVYGPTKADARYTYFKKPAALSFLPNWMFAFDFPHNVNSEGVPIENCRGQYCNKLPLPVFPTAFYETLMGLLIFGALWLMRKRLKAAGMIFSFYLILNGFERFFIEKIRVNSVYHIMGIQSTQAELIALILILLGVLGVIFSPRIQDKLIKL